MGKVRDGDFNTLLLFCFAIKDMFESGLGKSNFQKGVFE